MDNKPKAPEKPKAPKKPIAKGLQWKNLTYDRFNRRFPRIGMSRLSKRTDPVGQRKAAELAEYVWRHRRKRGYRYPGRFSPSKRKGTRFSTIMVPPDIHAMLRELSKFHGKSMSQIVRDCIEPLFEEAYKQAEVLARIEANRVKQEDEASNTDQPRRRYNV